MSVNLTDKESRFIQEYLLDLNATQSAIRAGYSENSARQIGSENLSKPHIQDAISRAMEVRSKRTNVAQDRVILELARIAFSNIQKYVTWGPAGVEMNHSSDLCEDDTACVSEVSETVTEHGGSRRFKLHDKLRALEMLGKHIGMFKESDPDATPLESHGKLTVDEALALVKAVRGSKE